MVSLKECVRCKASKELDCFLKLKNGSSSVCKSCRYNKQNEKDLFFKKVVKKKGCWDWNAKKNKNGYGSMRFRGKNMNAHRVSWIIHTGIEPNELSVCHTCDNRICCNPEHLFLGTAKDNVHDMIRKGRKNPLKGSNCPWAKLTENDIVSMLKLFEEGHTNAYVGKIYGIHGASAGEIKRGEIWGHIGDRSRIKVNKPKEIKINPSYASAIKRRSNEGENIKALSEEYGISPRSIDNIIKGKTWKNIT